jgi:catechol 2,3-dioxygenase-like lactoylglutathione lyase family enzyme
MLTSSRLNGFIPTKDTKKARSFYEGVLGLTFAEENEYVAVFRSGNNMIVAQKMDKFEPAQRTILGWEVENIREAVSFLTKRGVVFERYPWAQQDELGIWKSPQGEVAWFKDPDGNVLSVSAH